MFFHNITPAEFLPDWLKPDIARSFQQLRHLAKADRLWPFTSTNARVLLDAGMDRNRVEIVAPVVEWPLPGLLADKKAPPVRVLFVGRMIQSKGVLDLLRAIELLRSRGTAAFRLSQDAVGTDLKVQIEYRGKIHGRDQRMIRIIEPYRFDGSGITAYCQLRQGEREFKLNRIIWARLMDY